MKMTAEQLAWVVTSCPHTIERDKIVLRFDPMAEGHNALNQLFRRICAALSEADARDKEFPERRP